MTRLHQLLDAGLSYEEAESIASDLMVRIEEQRRNHKTRSGLSRRLVMLRVNQLNDECSKEHRVAMAVKGLTLDTAELVALSRQAETLETVAKDHDDIHAAYIQLSRMLARLERVAV